MIRRFLVTIGTLALVALVVIVATGGFILEVGPFRLTARGIRNPLIIAGAAWGLLLLLGPAAMARTTGFFRSELG